ncbi:MAG TPA: polyprenyl synthetase family protein [Chlamydiales bacterium]|nr:polyprenyl synthetase family protein [Chlamydiales bacterium]
MFLEAHLRRFEEALVSFVNQMGEKNKLRDACEYALLSGGKRIRPVLVLGVAEALGYGLDVMPAALSAEFFHTASLIADDLPSMDNDDFRRDRPSLHKAFGESVAILASYTLIAEGYGGIYRNQIEMRKKCNFLQRADEAAFFSLQIATRCGGLQGATNGQYLDLFPPDTSWKTVSQVMLQKTVPLFQLSFVFGWLFGGGELEAIAKVEECAKHLGVAFQIADDLDDQVQDQKEQINVVQSLGKEGAEKIFEEEMLFFRKSLEELRLWTSPFQEIYDGLDKRRRLFSGLRQRDCISC